MAKPNNPPLFDMLSGKDGAYVKCHISLRDLFAASALCGLNASSTRDDEMLHADAASYAYAEADALLAEREHDRGGE